ncbi:MAG: hypothetical protein K8F27_05855 [Sulfuricellaceae bacterium]|nr:hypothetical protein [Sulfuricellaceae bacterium]
MLTLLASPACADQISICYNYGCAAHAPVVFAGRALHSIQALFHRLPDAAAERQAIAESIGLFETISGEQTPTWRDKGGDENDDGIDGRMDCIDHATNTTAYLKLLEKHGWLRFHRVLDPVKRAPYWVNVHWAARIVEVATQQDYIVDAWFFDSGHPAAIFTLQDWMAGAHPHE